MAKHWAIEIEGSRPDFIPGPPYNLTAADAEETWRKETRLYFITIKVRPTTDDEDSRLGNPLDAIGKKTAENSTT